MKIIIQMRMWFKKMTYPLITKLDHVMGEKKKTMKANIWEK